MRRKYPVPPGTPLWCVYIGEQDVFIFLGNFLEADGETVFVGDGRRFLTFPMCRCFLAKEGAEALVREILEGGQA